MIAKYYHLKRISDLGIIAVIRAETFDDAMKIVEAVKNGGINIIEITLTVPGALQVMEELKKTYQYDEVLLGAGTVLDAETARLALLAGAEYVVSPTINVDVIKLCNRYQKLCIPGCMTPTEIIYAMESGADVIKLFPGNVFSPSIIKAITGPLPEANIIPTGGVSQDNAGQWIKNGSFAVGVGGDLTRGASNGNYQLVTETAKKYVEIIKKARHSD